MRFVGKDEEEVRVVVVEVVEVIMERIEFILGRPPSH